MSSSTSISCCGTPCQKTGPSRSMSLQNADKAPVPDRIDSTIQTQAQGLFTIMGESQTEDDAGSLHSHRAMLWLSGAWGRSQPTSYCTLSDKCIACQYQSVFVVLKQIAVPLYQSASSFWPVGSFAWPAVFSRTCLMRFNSQVCSFIALSKSSSSLCTE